MKFVVDTHTHTIASGHAYSTIIENAESAKKNGLTLLCMTDHASSMPGAPHYWYFMNQKVIPRFLSGVGLLKGAEVNILNTQGEIDFSDHCLDAQDWIIASLHEPIFKPLDKAAHTQTLLNVISSNKVDVLAHLGNPNFDFDFEAVIAQAIKYNVAIEINNSSLCLSRIGSEPRCIEIAKLCKKMGAYITTGSDAHFAHAVGNFTQAEALLSNIDFPQAKIITASTRQFLDFLKLRGRKPIAEFAHL
ncbi:hydrolase [Psychromonas sp. CNPT3]|uniref:phosphatase n=1 Tax=Psychromonas sp. CNPT3 TaxID=314282 RepID=UPI00006E56BC|nr:phosphatase [Psychromonas sp. CNPT3]AGH81333.1 hydrolase [Psychromonas sp. CNPT3]